jgi:anti-sigma factor RsiW
MTPEKFFDYLEGKLPPAEKERLERALISDPELQRQFVSARQIHRAMERPANGEPGSADIARAGSRGRQLAAAFAVLVAMNVFLGLFYIFHANKPSAQVQKAREDSLRHRLQSSVEKSAAAAFSPPSIGTDQIKITAPRERQDEVAQTVIAAASKAGGSGTKGLPNESGFSVLVIVPALHEQEFRNALAALGAPSPGPTVAAPATSPNEAVRLEIVVSTLR